MRNDAVVATVQIKDSLGAVSLVFTVLAFFVGRRIDRFNHGDVGTLGVMPVLEALLDFALAAVAVLAVIIVWPLLEPSGAFGSFERPKDVLPNLLAVVAAGFAALGVIEAYLASARLVGGAFLESTVRGVIAAVAVAAAVAGILYLTLH